MRHDKAEIFKMRKNGKSYREIETITSISRSTLYEWFGKEEWSKHIKQSNTNRQLKDSAERLKKMGVARRIMLDKKYDEVERNAVSEFQLYKENPLFMAGLMLYAGEGDKVTRGIIRLANTEFVLHKIFIRFVNEFLKIDMNKLRFSILLYPDLNIDDCKSKWSTELNIPLSNFHKPQVIQGKHKIKRLHFGVGSTIITSSFLKRKLLVWIDLAKKHLINK